MKSILGVAFALLCVNQASAQDTHAAFFANDAKLGKKTEGHNTTLARPASRSARKVASRFNSRPARQHVASGSASAVDSAARRHGVPVTIARAAVHVESKGRCNARGRAGELGPLQIKPATARGLGYRGDTSALATCGAGLEWGMRHLALAYNKCGHVGPHNYGLGGGCRQTAYVRKVMRNA